MVAILPTNSRWAMLRLQDRAMLAINGINFPAGKAEHHPFGHCPAGPTSAQQAVMITTATRAINTKTIGG